MYEEGQKLEFNIYGTTVEGNFIRTEGDKIIIMTTDDFIKENIGKEQSIHRSHPHKTVD